MRGGRLLLTAAGGCSGQCHPAGVSYESPAFRPERQTSLKALSLLVRGFIDSNPGWSIVALSSFRLELAVGPSTTEFSVFSGKNDELPKDASLEERF